MWKETAIFNTSNEIYSHKMIKMPHQLKMLNNVNQKHMDWLRVKFALSRLDSCYDDY